MDKRMPTMPRQWRIISPKAYF